MKEVFLLLFSLLGERLYGLGGAGNIARANLPIRFSIPCSQSSTGASTLARRRSAQALGCADGLVEVYGRSADVQESGGVRRVAAPILREQDARSPRLTTRCRCSSQPPFQGVPVIRTQLPRRTGQIRPLVDTANPAIFGVPRRELSFTS